MVSPIIIVVRFIEYKKSTKQNSYIYIVTSMNYKDFVVENLITRGGSP